jgi:tRNA pseudouridine13 synthase
VKLKRRPEDFEVTELTDVAPGARGRFGFYRLTKSGLGTPEAVDTVLRAWNLPRAALSYGGLKDRHALTRQHLTIEGGPPRDLERGTLRLEHLGRLERAFTAADLEGNRFRVVLRDLDADALTRALRALDEVREQGLPNYFDDQRFGSVSRAGEFVAAPWVAGDYEGALRVAFAAPNEHDRPRDREVKALLRRGWGDWAGLKERLPRGHLRSLVTHLADRPGDFRGALAIVRSDRRSLWLAAYQSHLWNRCLDAWIEEQVPASDLVRLDLKAGPCAFWTRLSPPLRDALAGAGIPLPSARVDLPEGPLGALMERALAAHGTSLPALDVKHPRGSFFSKGVRAALLEPRDLAAESAADELYTGREALTLRFDLPKGAYATMLVKRLTAVPDACRARPRGG